MILHKNIFLQTKDKLSEKGVLGATRDMKQGQYSDHQINNLNNACVNLLPMGIVLALELRK